jgi:hypothetical protein
MPSNVTGRRALPALAVVLVLVGCGALALLLRDKPEPPPPAATPAPKARKVAPQRFVSRPDLRPPTLTVDTPARGTAPGLVLLSPKGGKSGWGPMIVDADSRLVWFRPMKRKIVADDFKVQRYHGRPVLTWWQGRTSKKGYGAGSYVIADSSYREIARVRAGRGLQGDLHEFQITPQGTALIVAYHPVAGDSSAVGGPRRGRIMDSVIQEVDVATGAVRFEWHSLDHVGLRESHQSAPKPSDHRSPYDYFHINAVDVDDDGDLLVSARNTWAVYKVDRRSGRVRWRLGGKRSDFPMPAGTRFAWQHDIRRQPDGALTLFDNEAAPPVGKESRNLRFRVNERRRTLRLVKAVTHPKRVLAAAEGNSQWLPDGGIMVGWGLGRRVSEFAPDGSLRLDLRLPGDVDTYRAFRQRWTGRPARRPAVRIRGGRAYVSWNGATGVDRWQLQTAAGPGPLRAGATVARTGFETAIPVPEGARRLAVRALGAGELLATSRTVRVP